MTPEAEENSKKRGTASIGSTALLGYKSRLEEMAKGGDEEIDHMEADRMLCEMLIDLGYLEIVELYKKTPKWYA